MFWLPPWSVSVNTCLYNLPAGWVQLEHFALAALLYIPEDARVVCRGSALRFSQSSAWTIKLSPGRAQQYKEGIHESVWYHNLKRRIGMPDLGL